MEIKLAPYRRKKPAPTDYTTDEEDIITYDVEEDELEQRPNLVQKDDWALFTHLAVIPDATVKTESVDTAVQEVTNVSIAAADLSIPKVSSHSFQRYKPW
ncbi:hypothetical protein TNCV_3919641 [Trichonephila clavipes]|nr:hypothetical protein TNCV_3919641 [Trichonephila clavipes]